MPLLRLVTFLVDGFPGVGEKSPSGISRPSSLSSRGFKVIPVILDYIR